MDPLRIFLILFGLGMVIFVHELGHYLVARWAGVLVERFSIGFGPVLASFKRGDTEYALSAIPFGGYVKMLGQTDTPEVEEVTDDERSYQNQSVLERMAIISAGVVMNVIFGFVCFAIAYRIGVEEPTAVIGCAMPGKPAWVQGLRAGDRIVEINGHSKVNYETLMNEAALTDPESETVDMVIERDGERLPLIKIQPYQDDMKPVIGVLQGQGLEFPAQYPTNPETPASRAEGFAGGGKVVAVNGEKVDTHYQYIEKLYKYRSEEITVTIERESRNEGVKTLDVKVAPNYMRTLGDVQMKIGGVVAIQADSPAANAVDENGNPSPVQPKDIIQAVDGQDDFDPMRLADIITEKAGQEVTLTLLRPGTKQETINVKVVPRHLPTWIDFPEFHLFTALPASIPSLGIAYQVEAKVRKAPEDSPLKVNDRLKKAKFSWKIDDVEKDLTVDLQEDHWPAIFWTMQFPYVQIELTVDRDGKLVEVPIKPEADKSWPMYLRGINFLPDVQTHRETTLLGALEAGFERTRTSMIRLYNFLRSLVITRSISPQALAGPIRIVEVGYTFAADPVVFLLFIGMLNINLAVINFLPIPILDGGHMVFLTYELFMRRKPSERVIGVANWGGLALIGLLMCYVIFQDVAHIITR